MSQPNAYQMGFGIGRKRCENEGMLNLQAMILRAMAGARVMGSSRHHRE